jgi:hypothetical protein
MEEWESSRLEADNTGQHDHGQWHQWRSEGVVAGGGRGVTVCDQRMRQTHLPHVYVEWSNLDRQKDAAKHYSAPAKERELESIKLEWSCLEGRSDNLLRQTLQEARTGGCWVNGMLADLRLFQEARGEGSYGIACRFGPGHMVTWNGVTVYIGKCGMVMVETRNHATCTQEIPVAFRGEETFVDPFTLVLQYKATLVSCQEGAPPRWNADGRWICGYPDIVPCAKPDPLPVQSLGKSRTVVRSKEVYRDQQDIKHHHRPTGGTSPWNKGMPPRVLEGIARTVGIHWTLGYQILGPATTTAGLVVISIRVAEMLAIVIYHRKGFGPWILAAAWGTAFQVVSLPVHWALECGEQQAMAIASRMELERWSFPQPGKALCLSTKSRASRGKMQVWSG